MSFDLIDRPKNGEEMAHNDTCRCFFNFKNSINYLLDLMEKESEKYLNSTPTTRELMYLKYVFYFQKTYDYLDELSRIPAPLPPQMYLKLKEFDEDIKYYSVSGNPDNGFVITMPLLPRTVEHNQHKATRVIPDIVRRIVENYIRENNYFHPFWDCNVTLHYHVYFSDKEQCRSQKRDCDNVYTKDITDALIDVLYPRDDFLCVDNYFLSAHSTEGSSYTKLVVRKSTKKDNSW